MQIYDFNSNGLNNAEHCWQQSSMLVHQHCFGLLSTLQQVVRFWLCITSWRHRGPSELRIFAILTLLIPTLGRRSSGLIALDPELSDIHGCLFRKKGPHWKLRWCSVSGETFYVFRDSQYSQEDLRCSLRKCNVVSSSQEPGRAYSFKLVRRKGEEILLAAEDAGELERWLIVLHRETSKNHLSPGKCLQIFDEGMHGWCQADIRMCSRCFFSCYCHKTETSRNRLMTLTDCTCLFSSSTLLQDGSNLFQTWQQLATISSNTTCWHDMRFFAMYSSLDIDDALVSVCIVYVLTWQLESSDMQFPGTNFSPDFMRFQFITS